MDHIPESRYVNSNPVFLPKLADFGENEGWGSVDPPLVSNV